MDESIVEKESPDIQLYESNSSHEKLSAKHYAEKLKHKKLFSHLLLYTHKHLIHEDGIVLKKRIMGMDNSNNPFQKRTL